MNYSQEWLSNSRHGVSKCKWKLGLWLSFKLESSSLQSLKLKNFPHPFNFLKLHSSFNFYDKGMDIKWALQKEVSFYLLKVKEN